MKCLKLKGQYIPEGGGEYINLFILLIPIFVLLIAVLYKKIK